MDEPVAGRSLDGEARRFECVAELLVGPAPLHDVEHAVEHPTHLDLWLGRMGSALGNEHRPSRTERVVQRGEQFPKDLVGYVLEEEARQRAIPHPRVSAYGPGDRWVGSYAASTAADGTYVIGNVRPTDYRVLFAPPAGSGLASEWFDDAASRSLATVVTVPPGQTATGIDAQFPSVP